MSTCRANNEPRSQQIRFSARKPPLRDDVVGECAVLTMVFEAEGHETGISRLLEHNYVTEKGAGTRYSPRTRGEGE
jgi:hypothetical protein